MKARKIMGGSDKIRRAKLSDAATILKIYAPYIKKSAATFETVNPPLSEIRQRIKLHSKYGWYVFERDKKVIGYAYASRHRDRKAYDWCCEISAYIHEDFHRQGIARVLYKVLLSDLKKMGLVNVYAGITLPHKKSVGFHEAMGFKLIGVYKKIGYKLGAWHDVGWWVLKINREVRKPSTPRFA